MPKMDYSSNFLDIKAENRLHEVIKLKFLLCRELSEHSNRSRRVYQLYYPAVIRSITPKS
jgi:hypothetical protein